MQTLIFASSNPNKIREVREMLDGLYEIKGLHDIGCTDAQYCRSMLSAFSRAGRWMPASRRRP
jgi:inosine/xanthosine triphosphate pyrophosphatase family protein